MLRADLFVKDQIPADQWSRVATLLRTAYAAADDLVRDNPILQVASAKDNKGRLISWAVDFALERGVETGALRCDCRWRPFDEPTGRYLELSFAHSRVTVSRVSNPTRQPRNVVFRENARLSNGQGTFDFDGMVIEDEAPLSGPPHILLLHGYPNLSFAHWAVPSATSKTELLWRSPNLIKMAHEVPAEGPAPEDTDFDLKGMDLLKERIERWQRDNERG